MNEAINRNYVADDTPFGITTTLDLKFPKE